MGRYVMGITGASGAVYGRRVARALIERGHRVELIISEAGRQVLAHELGLPEAADEGAVVRFFSPPEGPGRLKLHDNSHLYSEISSGTVSIDGMVIVPCSMDTVSALATGRSENLLERAGDVTLKERRRLVIVPRETPLHSIHLRNLLTLSEAGAHVLPAMPGFYHRPARLDDLIDFIAGKVLNALGLSQDLFTPWQGVEKQSGVENQSIDGKVEKQPVEGKEAKT